MINPWSVCYSWTSLCLVFPLMLMSLAIPPPIPPHPLPIFHSHQRPWHQALWEIPLSSIPTIIFSNLKILINKPSKLGLRIPWAQCYKVPSLHISYSYPWPHPRLCHAELLQDLTSPYLSEPLAHCSSSLSRERFLPPRFPHSRSSTNILPPQSSSSPTLSGTTVYHFNYSLVQYPQSPCPLVLNSTHSRKCKTQWVNPDTWLHQFYIKAAAICWRRPHNYRGCISTQSHPKLHVV